MNIFENDALQMCSEIYVGVTRSNRRRNLTFSPAHNHKSQTYRLRSCFWPSPNLWIVCIQTYRWRVKVSRERRYCPEYNTCTRSIINRDGFFLSFFVFCSVPRTRTCYNNRHRRERAGSGQWESCPETGLIWVSIRRFRRRVVLAGVLLFNIIRCIIYYKLWFFYFY